MSVGIDELFDMLSWDSDEDTQKKGIELAKDVKCYSIFLQPHGLQHSKDVWENCAKILCNFPDETLQYLSLGLLDWLEDINWPGAEIILDRLIKFSDTSWLAGWISTCVKRALCVTKNTGWETCQRCWKTKISSLCFQKISITHCISVIVDNL